jgi:hypothetical protein
MAGVPANIANGSAVPRLTGVGDAASAAGVTITKDPANKGQLNRKPRRARVPRAALTSTYSLAVKPRLSSPTSMTAVRFQRPNCHVEAG